MSDSILKGLQPTLDSCFKRAKEMHLAERIWQRDETVFSQNDEAALQSIRTRLGWLDAPETFAERADELVQFALEVRDKGFTSVVLLGMGGSSLGVEVIRDVIGIKAGYPVLHVLDSTHPDQIVELESKIDLGKTLFIVASKSGTTIESDSFYRYFWRKIEEIVPDHPGYNFCAITDSNTYLSNLATERSFLKIFENPADIGGRFSALSYFGLVPAALMGVDLEKFCSRALEEVRYSQATSLDNPGLMLGSLLAAAYQEGRNKLFITSSKQYESFVYWAEQLIAESTGKHGKGILPVETESIPVANDAIVISLLYGNDKPKDVSIPSSQIQLRDEYDLAAQFFRWEFATAVCGALMEINPFDEPNVTESKNATGRVLKNLESTGTLPQLESAAIDTIIDYAKQVKEDGYVSILAYVARNPGAISKLNALRDRIATEIGRPVTVGFGPRYLHSTGQLHKGGPRQGVFALVLDEPKAKLPVPDKPFTFKQLVCAQAIGDQEALSSKGIPVKVFSM